MSEYWRPWDSNKTEHYDEENNLQGNESQAQMDLSSSVPVLTSSHEIRLGESPLKQGRSDAAVGTSDNRPQDEECFPPKRRKIEQHEEERDRY